MIRLAFAFAFARTAACRRQAVRRTLSDALRSILCCSVTLCDPVYSLPFDSHDCLWNSVAANVYL